MIRIDNKSDCCGCTACESICAHNAISMRPDTLGFLYPVVDVDKCVDCGLCDKVCAFNDNYDISQNLKHPVVYGARHKDITEVASSRSGAAFVAISDYVLENGGVVYGVAFAEYFRVIHKRAKTKQERNEFRGSKYVQSDLTGIFRQVKKDLSDGLTVLFSGTPCQTAGLRAFVGVKLQKKLVLIDIVCHGVPAPNIWRDYLNFLEKKYKSKIISVDFRDKNLYGWEAHRESYKFKSMKERISSRSYTELFYQHIMLRYSCEKCHYANLQRPSDITIADFWGWDKTNKEINKDDKGVSLILCNTEKGVEIFDAVKDCMTVFTAELDNCLQPNLQGPTIFSHQRTLFEKDYEKYGFEYVLNKYSTPKWKCFLRELKHKIIKLISLLSTKRCGRLKNK